MPPTRTHTHRSDAGIYKSQEHNVRDRRAHSKSEAQEMSDKEKKYQKLNSKDDI